MITSEQIASVLAKHQRRSMGLTGSSPDTCACGARIMPTPSQGWDDYRDISDRRDEAFAAHQAAALEAVEALEEVEWEYGITWAPYVTGDLQEPNSYGAETEAEAWEIGRRLAGAAQTVHVWKRPMRPAVQAVPAGDWIALEGETDHAE